MIVGSFDEMNKNDYPKEGNVIIAKKLYPVVLVLCSYASRSISVITMHRAFIPNDNRRNRLCTTEYDYEITIYSAAAGHCDHLTIDNVFPAAMRIFRFVGRGIKR